MMSLILGILFIVAAIFLALNTLSMADDDMPGWLWLPPAIMLGLGTVFIGGHFLGW